MTAVESGAHALELRGQRAVPQSSERWQWITTLAPARMQRAHDVRADAARAAGDQGGALRERRGIPKAWPSAGCHVRSL